MLRTFRRLLYGAGVLLLIFRTTAAAQSADNVLLVINDRSHDSVSVGNAYAAARAIPPTHVVHIQAPTTESIARAEYIEAIQAPIGAWIGRHLLHDLVLYIVLTKGVPIRVQGTGGLQGTVASVDSELTLLYRRLVGTESAVAGRVENPYFLGAQPLADARRFTRATSDLYLVTRLDGFTANDVLGVIERSGKASREGEIVLDQRATLLDRGGDSWLAEAASRVNALLPGRAALESTRSVAAWTGPVLGYFSWGSNDPAHKKRTSGLSFAPGAIGGMFVSTDGRTFAVPPEDWVPGESPRRGGFFGSGSQSLAADLIREGITGISAHVDEPFLDAAVRPQILFPAYLSGFTLAEAFYLAIPFLSWQTLVIGDPLTSPFAARRLTDAEIHRGLDAATGLPALFASRRLDLLARTGLNPEALKLVLRTESTAVADDRQETIDLLVKATNIEPRLTSANFRLALLYDEAGEFDRARERYQRVLAVEPDHVISLNNLAYLLAVRDGQPQKALPLAERAAVLSKNPSIVDTLGWIHHLLGDSRAAAPLVERALAALPEDTEILVHAAVIRATNGDSPGAVVALRAARKLDANVMERAEVKALARILGNLE